MVQITRRSFNASMAAGAALPALPAGVQARAAAHVATHHQRLWAEAIARGNGRASASLLSKHLGMAQEAASDLLRDLVSDKVLHAPDASGLCKAVKPTVDAARALPKAKGGAIEKLGKALDRLAHDTQDAPIEEPLGEAAPTGD